MDQGAASYRRFIDGDRDAFGEIIDLYRESLIFFIHRYVNDMDTAEDLAEDVFVELIVHPERFGEKSSLKTYVFAIARNKAIDWIRRHSRMRLAPMETAETQADLLSLEQKILDNEEKRQLAEAMDALKAEYRIALHLVYFEGMRHAEAAAALTYPLWAQGIATFFACMGFVILFNVHDWGSVLCALGSALTWIVYLLCSRAGFSIYSANFFSEVVAAVYSEGMGRWRKCPVTSYLVISSIPLLPGAGIYYTMSIGLSGSVQAALQKGLETAGIAGSLAVGILLVSTVFRAVNARRHPAAHL